MTKNLRINSAVNTARALEALRELLKKVNPDERQKILDRIERVEAAQRASK